MKKKPKMKKATEKNLRKEGVKRLDKKPPKRIKLDEDTII